MISFELPYSHYNNNNLLTQKNLRKHLDEWATYWNIDYTYKSSAIAFHVYFDSPEDFVTFRLTWRHSKHKYTVFKPNEVGTYVAV